MKAELAAVCIVLGGCATTSEWLERIGGASGTGLTQDQIVAGLKQALHKGTAHAVHTLGREGGFLENVQVRVPLPEKLRTVERTLRTLGQHQLVNEFETAMNRAAEKAVPEAVEVLASSIRQMRLADAEAILRGPDTAATDYFRRTSETNLYERFLPIVKEATAAVGVTAAYKRMMERVTFGGVGEAILGREAVDIDAYITAKALDALFLKIGEEEKLIRQNPAARTTELLRKVFGAVLRPSGPGQSFSTADYADHTDVRKFGAERRNSVSSYDARVISDVERRWHSLLRSFDFKRRPGKVVIDFVLTSDGRITDLKVRENEAGEIPALLCRRSILDPAPYPRWTEDMRRAIGADRKEISFTFYYGPKPETTD